MNRQRGKKGGTQGGETDFFGADLKRTKVFDKEILSIFNHLDEPLKKFGLRTGYFQLLVSSKEMLRSATYKEEYISFFDIGVLPDAVFNLPDKLRDAYAARAYFRSIVANPIGRIIREEYTEIGDTVVAFLERVKQGGRITWNIPRFNSQDIDRIIKKEGPKFLISLPENTEPKRARSMLRRMYEDFRDQHDPDVMMHIPEGDRVTYGALLFCALGERLQRDWKLNAIKLGYWKPQWETAAAHFLAVNILGLPAILQRDFPIDQEAKTAILSFKDSSALSIATRFKRGGRLHEFFA